MTGKRKLVGVLSLLVLGAVSPLTADMRFELGFGWTLVGPAMNATYHNAYAPPLTPPDRYISSWAEQSVRFKGKATYGMNGFFHVFFNNNLGLQVLADYHRPGLGGGNAPYSVRMNFLATEPESYSRSIDWPESTGNLTETSFSLNALARFEIADNLWLSVSGGPSVFHFEGKAGYLGYSFFSLEENDGQYQLSGGTYRLIVEFGPQTKYGYNIGIEAAYEAFRQVILAFDVRWFGAPRTDLPLSVVDDEVITQPVQEIEQRMGLGTLRVDPSYFRAGLAVRFIF